MKSLRFGAALAAAATLSVIHIGFPGVSNAEIRAVVSPAPRQRRKEARRMRTYKPLNRSRHWYPAASYKDARRISPFPSMAVR